MSLSPDSVGVAERQLAMAHFHDRGALQVAERQLAMAHFHAGRPRKAATMLQAVIARYVQVTDRELMNQYGQDNRVAAGSYLALAQWASGYPEQAARAADDALQHAIDVEHVHSVLYARTMGVCNVQVLLRRPEIVERIANEVLTIAEERSVGNWNSWALVNLGWALSQQNKADGIAEIETGMRMKQQMGAGRFDEWHRTLMADVYHRAGRAGDALASMRNAFEHLQSHDDMAFCAELYRKRAMLHWQTGHASPHAVEHDLERSLTIAREQGSLSIELRAARDLARLLAERHERQRALDLLAPVFSAFSEGFDTEDLREARQLLETLG